MTTLGVAIAATALSALASLEAARRATLGRQLGRSMLKARIDERPPGGRRLRG